MARMSLSVIINMHKWERGSAYPVVENLLEVNHVWVAGCDV
jgi:hypothetical protein